MCPGCVAARHEDLRVALFNSMSFKEVFGNYVAVCASERHKHAENGLLPNEMQDICFLMNLDTLAQKIRNELSNKFKYIRTKHRGAHGCSYPHM